MKQTQPKTGKLIAVILAAFFVFGAAGFLPPTQALAAKAKTEPTVGYVNRQQVFAGYPGIQDLMNRIQAMRAETQKDYDANGKDLPPADKKAYNDKLAQQEA